MALLSPLILLEMGGCVPLYLKMDNWQCGINSNNSDDYPQVFFSANTAPHASAVLRKCSRIEQKNPRKSANFAAENSLE
jgi:hypothetical protein